jgi:4-carboxymuconolactone decarboxylase
MAAACVMGSLLLSPAAAQAQRRMDPIPADKFTAEQKAALQIYQDTRGRPLTRSLFMDLLRVPDAMIATLRLREHVQNRNLFGDKLTEFALLITLREWSQRQEWSGHAFVAERVGLEPEVVNALAEGRYPRTMTDEESIIYDFTTELERTHGVSDETYNRMVRRFGEEGVIEAITIASLYTTVGMTLNTVREPIPARYNELPDLPQEHSLPAGVYEHPIAQTDPPPPMTPFRPTPPPPQPQPQH